MVSQFVTHVLQVKNILYSAANATHLAFNALRRLGRGDILGCLLLGSWLWCCAGLGELPCWVSAHHRAEVLHNPATADMSVLTSSMVAALSASHSTAPGEHCKSVCLHSDMVDNSFASYVSITLCQGTAFRCQGTPCMRIQR